MDILFNVLSTILWGLVMLSLIVLVHEAGHYTMARLCGMRVREFMLGLPGPSIGVQIGDTKYGVTPLLLGGYALIAGMQYESESPTLPRSLARLAEAGTMDTASAQLAERELGIDVEGDLDQLADWGTIKRERLPNGFYRYEMPADGISAAGEARRLDDPEALVAAERQLTYLGAPFYQRVLMLLGGAFFNLVFAVAVFTGAMMLLGDAIPTTTVEAVTEGSPAMAAGILPGDQLVAIDGIEVESWEDFYNLIGSYAPGDQVSVTVLRDGVYLDKSLALADNEGRAFLGVAPTIEPVKVGFGEALGRSIGFIGMVAVAIAGLLNPASFGEVVSQSTSVVGISVEASNAASAGFLPFIVLAAALSISIGLMNLLPLPPLDGGKIVLEAIQRLTRRTIPIRVINSISVAVMAVLGVLFVVLTWQDIQRYIFGAM